METIFKHRSIRKYKEEAIQDSVLDSVLQAAIRGSNTGNMQLYSIIVTKEKEQKSKLWESHFKQDMVNQAPVILTFCADINRFNKWCEQRNAVPGYDNFLWFYNATIDATIAAQNATLEAEYHQLGVCYLGTTTYMADKIIEVLDLPKGVVPVTTLVIGHPAETPELTDRLPLDAVIHNEKYTPYSSEQIEIAFADKEAMELTKKLIEENGTENLAQIFTDKRYKKADNEFFSQKFMELVMKNFG